MNIVVVGTLDTKGSEVGFLRDTIESLGHSALVVDPGILGQPAISTYITRQQVALAGGESLESLLERKDKAHAQSTMIRGLVDVITRLYEEGNLDGMVALGGAQGTAMATAAMRSLPVGVPKVMLSTVACGMTPFGPYVGTKDVTMIHSVADISGLNRVTTRLLAQAAHAVVGMASVAAGRASDRELVADRGLVAITQAGITTPGVMAIKDSLENMGFEVIAFHCNGIGGKAMEEMILEGVIRGVIDFSPHEITDYLYGGLMPAMPDRLQAAGQAGIPQIVLPGGTDIRLYGVGPDLPEELRQRAWVQHTPTHTHVRASPDEMAGVARFIAARLNAGTGPRAAMLPLRGFSMLNREGEPLFDPDSNLAYIKTMKRELHPDVRYIEVDAHINDPEFASRAVEVFIDLLKEERQDRQ
jgi:uncharacterized protein (UPF0261 family)